MLELEQPGFESNPIRIHSALLNVAQRDADLLSQDCEFKIPAVSALLHKLERYFTEISSWLQWFGHNALCQQYW